MIKTNFVLYFSEVCLSSKFNMAEKLKDERAPFRKIEESEAEPLQMPSKKRIQKKISGELLIYFWRFFFTFLCGPYTEILTFCFKRFKTSWFHCFWLVLTH